MPNATSLDDMEKIKKVDKSNMLSFCVDAPRHYERAARLAEGILLDYPKPKNIIVAGMGGSAISGELLKDWSRERIAIPIEVCREYSLPAYANEDTLVFVISYSGETEESLSIFLNALKRKCRIICASSGGSLCEHAEKLGVPHLLVPSGMAPRATLPYLFMPVPALFEQLDLVSSIGLEIDKTIETLKQVSNENSPNRPTSDNFAKMLALNIRGSIPVVYGFGIYRAVAQRLKTQFNENSKIPAKWESFPELSHNEIVGWEHVEHLAKYFTIILVRDKHEMPAIKTRIEVTKELLQKESLRTFDVWSKGEGTLAKMTSVVCIGDFASVYLAVLQGIDPTPVKTIDLLKKELESTGLKGKIISELESLAKR